MVLGLVLLVLLLAACGPGAPAATPTASGAPPPRAAPVTEEAWPIAGLSTAPASSAPGSKAPPSSTVYTLPGGKVVAWREAGSREVIEAATGYRLNVTSAPGAGTRSGPNGEAFYVYGFAWYPRWQRILPEPIIALIEDYYSQGVQHVRKHLEQYRQVAKPSHFGGPLTLVSWDESLLARMQGWGAPFPAAPYVYLPDSGTVDIRSERFEEALATGRVTVDDAAIEAYLASDIVRNSRYNRGPSRDDVERVLTQPYRRPEVFSDLEKALILAATFDGDQPLRIIIDMASSGGFFVPDSGAKTIFIAAIDVDLSLGYEGILLSKFAHEANHVLDFRHRRFLAERCWPEEDDMIETLKYLMELMWWVQRYPNDAASWDWEPINSGLVLVHLLSANFPNSRC